MVSVRHENAGKRLIVRATQPRYVLVIGTAAITFLLAMFLFGLAEATAPSLPVMISALIFITVLALGIHMPSYMTIDMDQDRLSARLWSVVGYDRYERSGLQNAVAIRVHIDSHGDSTIVKKYLVFKDNSEVEILAADKIENLLQEWYRHCYGIELAITGDKFNEGLLRRYLKQRRNRRE